MNLSGIDQAIWATAFVGEIALLLILLLKREYHRFPIFFVSIVVQAVNDPILFLISRDGSKYAYLQAYLVFAVIDYALQACILFEIGRAVLRPKNAAVSRKFLLVLSCFFLIGGIWTLHWASGQHDQANFSHVQAQMQRSMFVFAFLRLFFFALVAGSSQMLGITWRNHVIRLAGGLAFYSAVSLVAQLTISHLSASIHNVYVDQVAFLERTQVVAYVLSLLFWVWSFVQKDAPRREFTPQMQRFLVTMSQAARRNRVSFARSLGHK